MTHNLSVEQTGMKPNYLVIGAGKCATSSLCQLLGEHPEVFMSEPKEPNFFCNDEVYARGWPWYESLFAGAGNCKAIGEGSGRYSAKEQFPNTIARIVRHLPDAKLIYITRHPLHRLESMWLQKRSQGDPVPTTLGRWLMQTPDAIRASNYLSQIDAYREHFDDTRILVLFFEDFKTDPNAVLRRCFEFLDVDPAPLNADAMRPRNVSEGKKVDTPTLSLIRRLPLYETLRRLAPQDGRRWFKERFLRRPTHGRPQWDPQVRRMAIDMLAEDTERFLERYGKPADFWNISEA